MKSRKEYLIPAVSVVKMEVESLLTTFSSSGTIGGPVGIKRYEEDDMEWEIMEDIKEKQAFKVMSIWDDDIENE